MGARSTSQTYCSLLVIAESCIAVFQAWQCAAMPYIMSLHWFNRVDQERAGWAE